MKLTISYQPQTLPPPYAYAAVLKLYVTEDEITSDFSVEYLGRESLTADEIKSEGFTENDNYECQGNIGVAWTNDINELARLNRTENPDDEIYLHLNVNEHDEGFPEPIAKADFIFQELAQATLEANQIEPPFELTLVIDKEKKHFTWQFAEKALFVNKEKFKDWEWGRVFMKEVFSIDFDAVEPAKKPKKDALEFNGDWYSLNKKQINTLTKLMENE